MEEKILVKDCLNTLNYLINFENNSLLDVLNIELRNYLKNVRSSDESLQEELRTLGMSKGYIEKSIECNEKEVEKFRQNIIE